MKRPDDKENDIANIANSRDLETAGNLGSMLPGFAGTVSEGIGMIGGTLADGSDVAKGVAALGARLGTNANDVLSKSTLFRQDKAAYDNGDEFHRRGAKLGVDIAGAGTGALIGGAILPGFGVGAGAIVGGIAGRMGGGTVGSFIFPEHAGSNVQLACEVCNKQDQGVVMPEDVLRVVGRKASASEQLYIEEQVSRGNKNGFGMQHVTDAHLAPLLGDDFYLNGDCTACEYVARKLSTGEIDAGQLFMDEAHMQPMPVRKQDAGVVASYDGGFDASQPVAMPNLPQPGGRKGGKGKTTIAV